MKHKYFKHNKILILLPFFIMLIIGNLHAAESTFNQITKKLQKYYSQNSEERKGGTVAPYLKEFLDIAGAPIKEKLLNRKGQYKRVLFYPDNVAIFFNYAFNPLGIFYMTDIIATAKDIKKVVYYWQPEIEKLEFYDKTAFSYKGEMYTLYGPLTEDKVLQDKSFFLMRKVYERGKRTAIIYHKYLSENEIEVSYITKDGTEKKKLTIVDDKIKIKQDIMPELEFVLHIIPQEEVEADDAFDPNFLKCRLLLPPEVRLQLEKNPKNSTLLQQ